MRLVTEQEFLKLVLHTQYYSDQFGFPKLIDGPRWVKNLYEDFQRTGRYSGQERLSLPKTLDYARKLVSKSNETYGKQDFRTWEVDAQLATLEQLEAEIPIEDLVYRFYGIDVFKLNKLAHEIVTEEKELYCDLLDCKEENLGEELIKEFRRIILTPEEASLFLRNVDTIVKSKLRSLFSEEEIGETEIEEVTAIENGYTEPLAIGKSKVSISLTSNTRTPTNLLHVIYHESCHTIGYGMQMRNGKTTPENKVILLNDIHVPFQEGIANGGAILFYPDIDSLMEEINPLLPAEKKLNLFMATQYLKPASLPRAFGFTAWFDYFIKNQAKEKVLNTLVSQLGYTTGKAETTLKFLEKWKIYYPTYMAANTLIVPELKDALTLSSQAVYEKVKEFATAPDLKVLR